MISRLLLVGMVGVLGISLPDGADLDMGLTWARPGATVCACRREAVTFEPIAVGDDTTNRIADELNRRSEGLDLPSAAIVRVVAKGRPAAVAPVEAVAKMFAENEVWAGSAAEVVASIARPAATPRPVVAPVAPVVPAAKTDAVAEMFAENEVWAGSTAEVVASIARPAATVRPTFEPIAAAETDTSVAGELNRASEGLDLPRNPEPTVGTALRLTRDAALAWMNVLAKTIATEHGR